MKSIICLIALLASFNSGAIIYPKGASSSDYRQFAKEKQFAAVGHLQSVSPVYVCTAVLIDRYTILSSEHCMVDDVARSIRWNLQFRLGEGTKKTYSKLQGVRTVRPFSYAKNWGFNDLSVVYLQTPQSENPAQLSTLPPESFVGREIEFAGYGIADDIDCSSVQFMVRTCGVKYAARSQFLRLEEGVLWSTLDVTKDLKTFPCQGMPWEGDSGAPVFVNENEGYAITSVVSFVRGGAAWAAAPIFPFLPFIKDAMAWRDIETVATNGASRSQDWEEPKVWQDVTTKEQRIEPINNIDTEDEHGKKLRLFRTRVRREITLNSQVSIHDLRVLEGGHLHITPHAGLRSDFGEIKKGAVTFVIDGYDSGSIVTKKFQFSEGAHVVVDMRNLPRPISHDLDLEQLDRGLLNSLSLPSLSVLGETVVSSTSRPIHREAPKTESSGTFTWVIIVSKEISGSYSSEIQNPPPGYIVKIERHDQQIIVRATKEAP